MSDQYGQCPAAVRCQWCSSGAAHSSSCMGSRLCESNEAYSDCVGHVLTVLCCTSNTVIKLAPLVIRWWLICTTSVQRWVYTLSLTAVWWRSLQLTALPLLPVSDTAPATRRSTRSLGSRRLLVVLLTVDATTRPERSRSSRTGPRRRRRSADSRYSGDQWTPDWVVATRATGDVR